MIGNRQASLTNSDFSVLLGEPLGQVEKIWPRAPLLVNLEERRLLLLKAAPPLPADRRPPPRHHRGQRQRRGWAVRQQADNVRLARVRLFVDVEPALAGQVGEHVPLLGAHARPQVLVDDPLLVGDLVAPEPVLVAAGEAGDHNGDGQGEDEDPGEGAEASYQFSLVFRTCTIG